MFGKKKNEVKDIKHKVKKKEPKFYPNTLVNIKPAVVVELEAKRLTNFTKSEDYSKYFNITRFYNDDNAKLAFDTGFMFAVQTLLNTPNVIRNLCIAFCDFATQFPEEAKALNEEQDSEEETDSEEERLD